MSTMTARECAQRRYKESQIKYVEVVSSNKGFGVPGKKAGLSAVGAPTWRLLVIQMLLLVVAMLEVVPSALDSHL